MSGRHPRQASFGYWDSMSRNSPPVFVTPPPAYEVAVATASGLHYSQPSYNVAQSPYNGLEALAAQSAAPAEKDATVKMQRRRRGTRGGRNKRGTASGTPGSPTATETDKRTRRGRRAGVRVRDRETMSAVSRLFVEGDESCNQAKNDGSSEDEDSDSDDSDDRGDNAHVAQQPSLIAEGGATPLQQDTTLPPGIEPSISLQPTTSFAPALAREDSRT
jgi:hypothetical protein